MGLNNKKVSGGYIFSIIILVLLLGFGINGIANPNADGMGYNGVIGQVLLGLSFIFGLFVIINLIILNNKKAYIIFLIGFIIILLQIGNLSYYEIEGDCFKIYGKLYFRPNTFEFSISSKIINLDNGTSYYKIFNDTYFISGEETFFRNDSYIIKVSEGALKFNKIASFSDYFTNGKNIFLSDELIKGVDEKTFKPLNCKLSLGFSDNSNCGVDKNYVILGTNIIKGSDPKTFKILGDDFYIDNINVYFYNDVLKGADTKTFKYLGFGIAKDKNFVWKWRQKFEGVDVESFTVLDDGNYKDKNYVYYFDNILNNADTNTFKLIGNGFAKDKLHIWYQGSEIIGADPNTFTKIEESDYYKDKNHVYHIFTVIPSADPNTFKPIGEYGSCAKDKNYYFYDGIQIEKSKLNNYSCY